MLTILDLSMKLIRYISIAAGRSRRSIFQISLKKESDFFTREQNTHTFSLLWDRDMFVERTLPVPPLSKGISRCLRAHESKCHPFLCRHKLGVRSKGQFIFSFVTRGVSLEGITPSQ